MKKIIISLFIISLVFSLVACNQELNNEDLIIEIGDSKEFSSKEVKEAINIVKDNFDYKGCTLKKLYYDE